MYFIKINFIGGIVTFKQVLVTFLASSLLLFSGCGNDSSIDKQTDTRSTTGTFIDNAVAGLTYTCSSGHIGTTNDLGEFTCNEDDNVSFSLGSIDLGEIPAQEIVTPYSLFGGDKQAALNLARLLQTLDSDGDLTNGITLDEEVLASFETIDFFSETFEQDIQALLGDKTLVSEEVAKQHLIETFESLNINSDGSDNRTEIAPNIISIDTVFVDENQKSAITIEAIDDNNDTLTYSINGEDASNFDINSLTGVVTFKIASDYEASPQKLNYIFIVKVSDGLLSDTQEVTITILDVLEITYSWDTSDWGRCSGACGTDNALQSRIVTCKDSIGATVTDDICIDIKPDITQSCTASKCPIITYSWDTSNWGTCSGACGTNNASQSRIVTCENSTGATVTDDMCTITKPSITQSCTASKCPIITYSWDTSNWSACSGACGTNVAIKTRTSICKSSRGATVADSICSETKPTLLQSCTACSLATIISLTSPTIDGAAKLSPTVNYELFEDIKDAKLIVTVQTQGISSDPTATREFILDSSYISKGVHSIDFITEVIDPLVETVSYIFRIEGKDGINNFIFDEVMQVVADATAPNAPDVSQLSLHNYANKVILDVNKTIGSDGEYLRLYVNNIFVAQALHNAPYGGVNKETIISGLSLLNSGDAISYTLVDKAGNESDFSVDGDIPSSPTRIANLAIRVDSSAYHVVADANLESSQNLYVSIDMNESMQHLVGSTDVSGTLTSIQDAIAVSSVQKGRTVYYIYESSNANYSAYSDSDGSFVWLENIDVFDYNFDTIITPWDQLKLEFSSAVFTLGNHGDSACDKTIPSPGFSYGIALSYIGGYQWGAILDDFNVAQVSEGIMTIFSSPEFNILKSGYTSCGLHVFQYDAGKKSILISMYNFSSIDYTHQIRFELHPLGTNIILSFDGGHCVLPATQIEASGSSGGMINTTMPLNFYNRYD